MLAEQCLLKPKFILIVQKYKGVGGGQGLERFPNKNLVGILPDIERYGNLISCLRKLQ